MTGFWRGPAPLILASKSAARQRLLAAAGLPFEVCSAQIDERAIEAPLLAAGMEAPAIARRLAQAKALDAAAKRPGRMVIGADQTLSLDGRVLGKPADHRAAVSQLSALSGRMHELYSACCIVRGIDVLFETVGGAKLSCRNFSSNFIKAYAELAGDALLSSAGAYQIEGLGIHLFDAIEGDHATILGLPLLPVLKFLREEGSLLP